MHSLSHAAPILHSLLARHMTYLRAAQFTGTACYNLASKDVTYKLSCKDLLLHGKITLDPSERSLQYRSVPSGSSPSRCTCTSTLSSAVTAGSALLCPWWATNLAAWWPLGSGASATSHSTGSPALGGQTLQMLALATSFGRGGTQEGYTCMCRVGFEFRSGGGAEAVALNSLRLKPRLYLGPLGVEAKTQVTVQLPSKLLVRLPAADGLQ